MKAYAITAAAALALGLAGGHWLTSKAKAEQMQRYEARIAQINADHAQAVAKANQAALNQTKQWEKDRADAQENHAQTIAKLQADIAGSRRAADRLRDTIATQRLQLSQLSEQAVRSYADAASVVFAQCGTEYQRMAAVADQCIADLGLMREAWPR
ncbi:hypothetical protein E8K88_17750 [Lampropedia aestuarii]|uniref:DUF2514 family protein n=1 Tax=Lampropedia aestuarii TaxID=2562762 RepID=A0A4S5BE64_9BURK|nr:hypothetical protein [Lampropedia aestuarii]THJ30309.1 hypothetical protein E8K88_17750 [Lampropedia aestuarii]